MDNTVQLLNNINISLGQIFQRQEEMQRKIDRVKDTIKKKGDKTSKGGEVKISITGQGDQVLQAVLSGKTGADNLNALASGLDALNEILEQFDKKKVGFKQTYTDIGSFFETLKQSIQSTDEISTGDVKKKLDTIVSFFETLKESINEIVTEDVTSRVDTISKLFKMMNEWEAPDSELLSFFENTDVKAFFEQLKQIEIPDQLAEKGEKISSFFASLAEVGKYGKGLESDKSAGLHSLLSFMEYVSTDDFIKRVDAAGKNLTEKKAQKLAAFFTRISEIFENVKAGDNLKNADQLVKMIELVTKPGFARRVWTASFFLSKKVAKKIGGFYNAFIEELTAIDKKDLKGAAETIQGINGTIHELTKSIMLLALTGLLIVMTDPIGILLTMAVMIKMMHWMVGGMVKVINKLQKDNIKDGMNTLNDFMGSLAITIGIFTVISLILAKAFDHDPVKALVVVLTIGLMMAGILGIVTYVAAMSPMIAQAKEGMNALTKLMFAMSVMLLSLMITEVMLQAFGGWSGILQTLLLLVVVVGVMAGIVYGLSALGGQADVGIKNAEKLLLIVIGLNAIILLGAITAIVLDKTTTYAQWGYMFTILLGILVMIGIMTVFMNAIGKEAEKSLATLILCVLGLTLSLMFAVVAAKVANSVEWESFAKVGVVLLGLIGIIVTLSWVTKAMTESNPTMLKDLAILTACMVGLAAMLLIIVKVAKYTRQIDMEDLGKTGLILGALTGILAILALVANLAKGQAVQVAILMACLAGLVGILAATLMVAKASREITLDDFGRIALIFGGLLVAIVALGLIGYALTSGPQAALIPAMGVILALMGGMTLVLGAFVGLCMLFGEAEKKYGDLGAIGGRIGGAFGSFLKGLATLTNFGLLLIMPIMSWLSMMMWPLLLTLSMFIGIVKEVAEMKVLEGYDDNGKPKYRSLPPDVFEKSAKAISSGFSTFLKEVADGFDKMGVWSILAIKLIGNSMKPIMEAVGMFTDTVIKVATGQYIEDWEEVGGKIKPVYGRITPDEFKNAGVAVAESFGTFISSLADAFDKIGWRAALAIDTLSDCMKPVMDGVSAFADAILKLGTGTYISEYEVVGEGENAKIKPVFERAEMADYEKAAQVLANNFGSFLKTLIDAANDLGYWSDDSMEAIANAIKPVMDGMSAFADSIFKMATGTYIDHYELVGDKQMPVYKKATNDMYKEAAITLGNNFKSFLKELIYQADAMSGDAEDGLEAIGNSIAPIMQGIGAFADSIFKLASGTYIDRYDVYGEGKDMKTVPHYTKIPNDAYKKAASVLAEGFTAFVSILKDKLAPISSDAEDVIEDLTEGGLADLMKTFSQWSKVLEKFTDPKRMYVIDSYDEKGNPIFAKGADGKPLMVDYGAVASVMSTSFVTFIQTMVTNFSNSNIVEQAEKMEDMLRSVNGIWGPIKKFQKILAQYKDSDIYTQSESISNHISSAIIGFLNNLCGENDINLNKYATKDVTLKLDIMDQNVSIGIKMMKRFSKFMDYDFVAQGDQQTLFFSNLKKFMSTDLTADRRNLYNNVSDVIRDLGNLDKQILKSNEKILRFRDTTTSVIEKIEERLQRNETRRNEQLKTLTTHLSNIGDKIKTINEGLTALSKQDLTNLNKVAEEFANMTKQAVEGALQVYVNNNQQGTQQTTPSQNAPQQVTNNNNTTNNTTNAPVYVAQPNTSQYDTTFKKLVVHFDGSLTQLNGTLTYEE